MPRSPPPPAINPHISSLAASLLETETASDLPLRNFTTSTGETTSSDRSQTTSNPPIPSCRQYLAVSSSSEIPSTPSSVVAEYGEHSTSKSNAVERVVRSSSNQPPGRSRSQSGGPPRHDGVDVARSSALTQRRQPLGSRSHSVPRNDNSTSSLQLQTKLDRVNSFLQTIPQSPRFNAAEELLVENRSLHQRIAALQRTEQTLLKDTQDLSRRLATSQQRYESRRQHWKDELRNRENAYEARIRELEFKIAKQEKELKLLKILNRPKDRIADHDITSWFATRTGAWGQWAQKYVHRDPTRVQSGLHPLQMRELCHSVKDFVRLTKNDQLPKQLLASNHGDQPALVLLTAMVSNFIIKQTLESPFWVFDVISAERYELASPSVPRNESTSPVGFRMDLGSCNTSSVAPPKTTHFPEPTINAIVTEGPQNGRQLPHFKTSFYLPALDTSTDHSINILDQKLPSREEMEALYDVFCKFPGGTENAQVWRSRLIKAFSDGGMSLDLDNTKPTAQAGSQSRRLLAESRKRYATRLKDRFLHGAARLLLENQDAAGIESLEHNLIQEIDAALRFSCQLWSRQDGVMPSVKGLKDLSGTHFSAGNNLMELCRSQAPVPGSQRERPRSDAPPGYHDGDEVMVVVQPAVEVINTAKKLESSKGEESSVRVWTKARVLVAAPAPSLLVTVPSLLSASEETGTTKTVPHADDIPWLLPPLKERVRKSTSSMPSAEVLLDIAFKGFDPKGLEGGAGNNMKLLPDVPISLI